MIVSWDLILMMISWDFNGGFMGFDRDFMGL